MKNLTENEIKKKIETLGGWLFFDIAISKEFIFKDFQEAIDFINEIALIAERNDHHPDILLHSWNKVKIYLSTRSTGGVTLKDFEVAEEIQEINM